MQNNGAEYPSQTYPCTTQVVNPGYPGLNGRPQEIQINRQAAKGLGGTQMAIGIICFILNIGCQFRLNGRSLPSCYIGYGIWGGMLFFVAGILQVLSASKMDNRCLVIGTMVMSIISACDCAVVLALGIIDAYYGAMIRNYYFYSSAYLSSYSYYTFGNIYLAFGIIMAILAVTEASIAIATSALCCRAVCCKSSDTPYPVQDSRNVVYYANNPGPFCQIGRPVGT